MLWPEGGHEAESLLLRLVLVLFEAPVQGFAYAEQMPCHLQTPPALSETLYL